MKHCTTCGKELQDGAKFCPGCGAQQEIKETTVQNNEASNSANPFAYTPQPVPTNTSGGKSVGSLVCGILSIVFAGWIGLILGIIAVVLGSKALESGPDGKAKAGKVCGIIGIVISGLALAMLLFLGAAF